MIRVTVDKNAMEVFWDALMSVPRAIPAEPKRLYDWIVERNQYDALDEYVNREYPLGTDEDEYFEFFLKHWKEIAEALGCDWRELED